ncbi:hypothetical protein PC111_g24548 [Phytophthora cactorum]|nr:hypothetical protein PC111_g24548 [Phytophthora cactorum]KAG3045150.1 hypothetical protein PC122_g24670 [Phytophthora cactorum]
MHLLRLVLTAAFTVVAVSRGISANANEITRTTTAKSTLIHDARKEGEEEVVVVGTAEEVVVVGTAEEVVVVGTAEEVVVVVGMAEEVVVVVVGTELQVEEAT